MSKCCSTSTGPTKITRSSVFFWFYPLMPSVCLRHLHCLLFPLSPANCISSHDSCSIWTNIYQNSTPYIPNSRSQTKLSNSAHSRCVSNLTLATPRHHSKQHLNHVTTKSGRGWQPRKPANEPMNIHHAQCISEEEKGREGEVNTRQTSAPSNPVPIYLDYTTPSRYKGRIN